MQNIALFDNSIETVLPDDFTDMPLDLLQIMFPNEMRPQVIKGAADGSYATFSLLDMSLSGQQLFSAIYGARDLLQRFHPDCSNQKVYVIPLEDSMCGWFSFSAHDKKNFMFIIAIEDMMILGTCGCPEDDEQRVYEMKMIFESIKTIPLPEEGN